MKAPLHVAVAAIANDRGEYLLTRRHDHLHQGGLWEFPGGKVEAGEPVEAALARELHEELGITARAWEPLIRVHHRYPDLHVLLDVFRVTSFAGDPQGREGQPFVWAAPRELSRYPLPEADRPIVLALTLPDRILITPEPEGSLAAFLARLDARLARGDIHLAQLRAKTVVEEDFPAFARDAVGRCHERGVRVFVNAAPWLAAECGADGAHLDRARLFAAENKVTGLPLSAAVHDLGAVERANRLGVEFMLASPVAVTATHPNVLPLGWAGFARLCEAAAAPVYALGGMDVADIPAARAVGGQGIAAIRALWK